MTALGAAGMPPLQLRWAGHAMNTVDLVRRLEEEFYEPALCEGMLEFSGRSEPVEVLALSAHSADLRCGDDIVEDGPVALAIDGFRRFEGELVRSHGRIIGMVFRDAEQDGTKVTPAPKQPPEDAAPKAQKRQSMRRHPRSAVFWSGAVQAGRESVDCIVLNMSPGGAKLKMLKRFVSDGSPVVLHIDRLGGYAGEIIWSEGDTVGLRFLRDPREVAADIEQVLYKTKRPD